MEPQALAAFLSKLETFRHEFGGVWLCPDKDSNYYYYKGDAPETAIFALRDWSEVIRVEHESAPPHDVSHQGSFTIKLDDVEIGTNNFEIIAGPCSVEDYESLLMTAKHLAQSGVQLLRAGAFKPRTSPYSFQGLGVRGLEILESVRKETGLQIVTEVLDPRDIEEVAKVSDILQVGSRNMSNTNLLKEVGKLNKPVLLKRGMAATVKEFLYAAEYVATSGNNRIILCERGLRHFDPEIRNILDLSIVPLLKQKTHLPVFVDPSHGTGRSDLVPQMMLAAAAASADGLLVEVHNNPQASWSDAKQAISVTEFNKTLLPLNAILEVSGRRLSRPPLVIS